MLYWADQSSQGRLKIFCNDTKNPTNQPRKDPFHMYSLSPASVSTREAREGWPMLTVEIDANGDSWSTCERSPSLVGSLGSSCQYNRFLSCFGFSSQPTAHFFAYSPSPSNLGRQSCWVACLCVSGFNSHHSLCVHLFWNVTHLGSRINTQPFGYTRPPFSSRHSSNYNAAARRRTNPLLGALTSIMVYTVLTSLRA